MKLYPHQRPAADWLKTQRNAGLFDEQGLGKTISAIVAWTELQLRPVLVLAPPIVLWNWKAEIEAWSPGVVVQVVETGKDRLDPLADVVITTHGLLLQMPLFGQLVKERWALCVVDEAHFFRSRTAQRTQLLYGQHSRPATDSMPEACVRACCDRVWILTGTPMPNHAGELWAHLRALWPERIRGPNGKPMSYSRFEREYCLLSRTRWGMKPKGNRNVEKLRETIAGTFLRRKTEDVLKDLPPIRYEQLTLRPQKLPWELEALEGEIKPRLRKHAEKALASKSLDDEQRLKLAYTAIGDKAEFATYRRLCGLAKAQAVLELLQMELEHHGLEKVVVFAHHTAVVDLLKEGLASFGVVTITGATPAKIRQHNVQRFQKETATRVAICQIVAGGTGTTLTASREVIFAELSFIPGENAQAAKRCHRIGQKNSVRVRFVALAGTVDEAVTTVLRRKTAAIRQVME